MANVLRYFFFLLFVAYFAPVSAYASKKLNADIAFGKLVPPGPFEYLIYHSMNQAEEIDREASAAKIRELEDFITSDGGGKDANTVMDYASANYDVFVADYLARFAKFRQDFWAWQISGRKTPRPIFKLGEERAFLQKAQISFRRLIFDFPKDKHSPELYQKISLIVSLSKNQKTMVYLKKLLKDYPKSGFKGLALLQIANAHFYDKRFGAALKNYRKLVKAPDRKIRMYAKYMTGWSMYFRSKQKPQVMARKLRELASMSLVEEDPSSDFISDLILSDLVKVWDKDEDLPKAEDFFKRSRKYDFYLFLLERVAKSKIQKKSFSEAIDLYQQMISGSTIKVSNPSFHESILDIYLAERNYPKLVETFEEMEQLYLKGSAWTAANRKQVPEAKQQIEKKLRRAAALLLKNQQKQPDLLEPLMAVLEMYLKWYPKGKAAVSMRLRLAQLQGKNSQHFKAALNYKALSESTPRKKLKYNAFKYAIDEMGKSIKTINLPRPNSDHPLSEAFPFPDMVKTYIDYLAEYTKEYKKNDIDIRYRSYLADTNYTYGHYQEAIAIWAAIIEQFPDSKWAQVAIKNTNNFYLISRKWQTLNSFAYKMVAGKKVKDERVLAQLMDSVRQGTFTSAKKLAAQGKFAEALALYLRYQKTFPKAKDTDLALYEGFQLAGKLEQLPLQLDIGQRFSRTYKASKLQPEMLISLGAIYTNLLDVYKASLYLSSYVRRFPKHPKVADSYMEIGKLHEAAGNLDKAVLMYLNFARSFPGHPAVAEALKQAMGIAKNLSNPQIVENVVSVYLASSQSKDPASTLLAKVIVALQKKQNLEQTIAAIIAAPAKIRLDAAKMVSEYLLTNIKAAVNRENSSSLDTRSGFDAFAKMKKSQFKAIENIHKQVVLMGHPDYLLESHFYMASLFANYSTKLQALAKKSPKDRVNIENLAFEAEELGQSYFEFINKAIKRNFSVQGKQVYRGMSAFKRNYTLPRDILLQPTFAAYSAN